ncbi:MAG TPA: FAD-dependent oxidoreductase [Chthoniobacterales bacterium]
MNISRRHFLGTMAGAALVAGCTEGRSSRFIEGEIIGASSGRGHRLRTMDFPLPSEVRRHEVVIIGGGIAGLAAGRHLKQRDVVLLELEDHTGGNSSHGANAVSSYPWGAHYVTFPSSDAHEVTALFEELGIITGRDAWGKPIYNEVMLVADPSERLFMHGRWQEGLLPQVGATDADLAEYASFAAKMEEFKNARGADGRRAFTIPVDRSSSDPRFTQLDDVTMSNWLRSNGFRSEKLRWYVDYACRDDFGGTVDQISAWAGIHYFAARDGIAANASPETVITWPEGNGWLERKLRTSISDKIRTNHLAWNVESLGDNVRVDAYDFATNRSIRFEASHVIVCAPHFIAQRIVKNLQPEVLEYGPWAVANLTVNRIPEGEGFAPAWDNVFYDSKSLGYVDCTHQHLARPNGLTVLTWYAALCDGPPAGERQKALARSHADWCDIILADMRRVHPEIDQIVRRIDVCIWGHGMIRPVPGQIWGGVRERLAKTLGNIHFAHSDLSGLSIFEEAYTRGIQVAEAVMARRGT